MGFVSISFIARCNLRRLTERHRQVLIWRSIWRPLRETGRPKRNPGTKRERGAVLNRPPIIINAPEVLSFSENYAETAQFLCSIRDLTESNSNRPLLVEMKAVRDLRPAAALALVAELDRWQRRIRRKLKPRTVENWDTEVKLRLASMGFFKLLGTRIPKSWIRDAKSRKGEYWLSFTSGLFADGRLALELRTAMEKELGPGVIDRKSLYRSLVESMKNAVEHAYPHLTGHMPDNVGKRWWMFGVTDAETGAIKVVFLDQGISIPASLPGSWLWAQVTKNLDRLGLTDADGALISTAIELGRSRHRDVQGRGRGLADIVRPTNMDPRNRLRIISRHGVYSVVGREPGVHESRSQPLNGTLIEWHLQMPTDGRTE